MAHIPNWIPLLGRFKDKKAFDLILVGVLSLPAPFLCTGMNMELKFVIDRIMEKSELSEEEVLHNIRMKKAEFQELIDEPAAAKLIAKELGVQIEEEENGFLSLSDVQSGRQAEANVVVRVMNIFSPKSFETERKKGKVCNMEVADNSARAVLVLWDEDVAWMEKNALERDDVLVLKGVQVKSYNPLEIHSSLLTEIILLKPSEFIGSKYYKPLPQQPSKTVLGKDLREGETVDLFGRVLGISEMREFRRESRIGKVLNILIADASGMQVPVVLWDYQAERASRALNPGMAVKIENALVKKSMAGLELGLNWSSNLVVEPRAHNLRREEELLSESLPTVRILDLKAGQRGIVKATLSKIIKAEIVEAGSKPAQKFKDFATGRNAGIVASHEAAQSGGDPKNLSVQAELRDEINVLVNFSGRQALEILQLRSIPALPLDLMLKLKEEYIKGKRVSLVARKEKDKTGRVAKFYCEHILTFT